MALAAGLTPQHIEQAQRNGLSTAFLSSAEQDALRTKVANRSTPVTGNT